MGDMNSNFIIEKLFYRFHHNPFKIRESFVYGSESDFLVVTQADLTHEFEVKISRSDFKADFKKPKHRYFEALLEGKTLITIPGEERNRLCSLEYLHRDWKIHQQYYEGEREWKGFRGSVKEWYCDVWFSQVKAGNHPNKFSFVVPEGLVTREEVPHYAGLYYVYEDGHIKEIKRAKFLHKEKFTKWKTLASKFYWKWINGDKSY